MNCDKSIYFLESGEVNLIFQKSGNFFYKIQVLKIKTII